jgi:hypothetical protein
MSEHTTDIELTTPIPDGATIRENGEYLVIRNAQGHPIATHDGSIPYHRFVLYEKLQSPWGAVCRWCEYPLLWKTRLSYSVAHVVCADHLDGNKANNDPDNLVASCDWCNKNRNWAENYPEFWDQWRRWMSGTVPSQRPDLINIAREQGIEPESHWEQKADNIEYTKRSRINQLRHNFSEVFKAYKVSIMETKVLIQKYQFMWGGSDRTVQDKIKQALRDGTLTSRIPRTYSLA